MPSSTVEDYIKHIYLAGENSDSSEIAMGRVAEALGVVPGTATTMVKALSDAGLVHYAPRVGVSLTIPGRKLALHVLRRHRLLEQFLVEVLRFDWSEVHEEAERLEHEVSDLLMERIDAYLGHPTEDPHGDPIPSAAGEMRDEFFLSLVECELNTDHFVARISDQDPEFLQYIGKAGLNPGATVRVLSRSPVAESIEIEVCDVQCKVTLGFGAAAKVMIRTA